MAGAGCARIDAALDRLADAWAARDADAVAAAFAPDGVYSASVGRDPGTTVRGRSVIRDLAAHMFANDTGESEITEGVLLPDGPFWAWRILGRNGATTLGRERVRGRDDLVVLKDAYRKTAS